MSATVRISTLMAVVAGAALLAGCREVKGEAAPPARPVKVMEARPPEAPAGVRYSVSIQPYEQIPLSFKSGGYVDSVLRRPGADGRQRALQAGDIVRAGTVVARVREADYRERVSQAASSLRELEVAQTKAALDLDRAQYLFAAQALAKPDRDAAQAAYDGGTARLQAARAQVSLAEIALRESALVAPATGIILERKIEAGALVGAGTVGFVLGDVSAVKAVFGVPDSVVHRIAPGQPMDVTTEAFHGERFAGRITTVAPSADRESRVFDIEVTIPNGDGRLRPGMIGSVELAGDATPGSRDEIGPGATAVPLTAIVRSAKKAGEYTVFVVEGGSSRQSAIGAAADDRQLARARAVTLGPVRGNLVSIARGLTPGERVVVMGASLLVDGETVKVIP